MRVPMFAALVIASAGLWLQVPGNEEFTPTVAQAERIEHLTTLLAERTDRFAMEETLHLAVNLVRAADRHDLDATLLLAVIEVESSYRRTGRSNVGALGLMQLMPSTARAFAKKAGVKWRGPRSLLDPDTNIEIGATYLAYLFDRFDGDADLALAAYCHGPAAIRRALRSRSGLSARQRGYGRRVLDVWRSFGPNALAPNANS